MTPEEAKRWETLFMDHRKQSMQCSGLMIDNVPFYCAAHSDADRVDWKREEDEMNARETLEWHRRKYPSIGQFEGRFTNWQGWLMFLLTPIAKHYSVSKDTVLSEWTRDTMPTIIYEQTGQIWLPGARQPRATDLLPHQPCNHPGCLSHLSHPCEGCGRIGGRYPDDRTNR